jgi:hypothetical protein
MGRPEIGFGGGPALLIDKHSGCLSLLPYTK